MRTIGGPEPRSTTWSFSPLTSISSPSRGTAFSILRAVAPLKAARPPPSSREAAGAGEQERDHFKALPRNFQ